MAIKVALETPFPILQGSCNAILLSVLGFFILSHFSLPKMHAYFLTNAHKNAAFIDFAVILDNFSFMSGCFNKFKST